MSPMQAEPRPVHHIAHKDIPRGVIEIPENCHVVIPAKDVENTIEVVLNYFLKLGFPADRVHVIVNGTTDSTADVAEATDCCTVHRQDEIFDNHPMAIKMLREKYGIDRDRLRGKGTAMFASVFMLEELGLPDDAPIMFVDGDILNIGEVKVGELLLHGWKSASNPHMVKLASLKRNNEGIHAFLGMPGNPYKGIGAVKWPLCGQVIVPWGILRSMRLATHYAIEIAMLMQIWEQQGDTSVFCEVEIGVPLMDDHNDDRTHVLMYQKIMAFMAPFLTPGRDFTGLEISGIHHINVERSHESFWVPPGEDESGPMRYERHPLDAILPSLAELML